VRALLLAALLILTSFTPGWAAERGEVLAGTCRGCHGLKSEPGSPIPSLAGMNAKTLKAALLKFKTNKAAASTLMGRIMRGYTETDITLMANALSTRVKR